MITEYLEPGANDDDRRSFFSRLTLLIDEVTLTRRAIHVEFDNDKLTVERGELPDKLYPQNRFDEWDDE